VCGNRKVPLNPVLKINTHVEIFKIDVQTKQNITIRKKNTTKIIKTLDQNLFKIYFDEKNIENKTF
jgi:hypothetical protein